MIAEYEGLIVSIVLILFIVKEVVNIMQIKKQLNRIEQNQAKTLAHTEALYNWHNKTDEDGVPVWYVRRSLESAIERLAENIQLQTEILRSMMNELKMMQK